VRLKSQIGASAGKVAFNGFRAITRNSSSENHHPPELGKIRFYVGYPLGQQNLSQTYGDQTSGEAVYDLMSIRSIGGDSSSTRATRDKGSVPMIFRLVRDSMCDKPKQNGQ
jgi:hypothetical protein